MKLFRDRKVTRKYALKAALYRMVARGFDPVKHTFTKEDLIEMFEFESKGAKGVSFAELKTRNGFALGKWLRDLDVSQMVEDVKHKEFRKEEFMETALGKIHNRKILDLIS